MTVTLEVVSVIVAVAGAAAGLIGGVYLFLRHFEAKIDRRFDQVDKRFDQVDKRFERLEDRIDSVASDVIGLKVAVARIEGDRKTLLRP